MRLESAAIGNLARMICGDKPYQGFPHRSSSHGFSRFTRSECLRRFGHYAVASRCAGPGCIIREGVRVA